MAREIFEEFRDKVAVVTGAASGIGAEMVRQLCRSGAVVVAADQDEPRLQNLTQELAGHRLTVEVVDVTDTERLRELIDGTAERFGRLDYMVNNAGIAGRSGEIRELLPEDWEKIIKINQMAVIFGTTFAYRHMVAQRSGHIVNMASAAGLVGTPTMSAYGTVKAAVVEFSRDLRVEAEDLGVKVTVLCPGFIESRIFENADLRGRDPEAVKASLGIRFLPTDTAVEKMLRGVLQGKSIIAFPGYVKVLWLLRRLFPLLTDQIVGRRTIRGLRAGSSR